MYGDGEYCACMPARRSIAVTASTSARSSSIWRESVQRLSCRSETVLLTGRRLFEDIGELSRARQERRMASGDLDGFDSHDGARRPLAVVTGHHAVTAAQDVGGGRRGPFAERGNLLSHAPELTSESGGRVIGDPGIAVVIENFDCACERP